MNELFNLGIDEMNIKFMIESNPNIMDMDEKEVNDRIELLKELGCDDFKIRNILIGNPWYLDRCITDVIKMINKLSEIGLDRIDLLIDSNPLLLNIDSFEIDDFIEKKMIEGYTIEDIVDMIEDDSNVIVD